MDFNFDNLIWGISEKKDGRMKVYVDSDNTEALENRAKFFKKLNIAMDNVVSAGLIHDKNVFVANQESGNQIIPDTDALITNQKNLFLTITVADCLPIYFYDFKKEIIGIAHAGWKGVQKNIAQATVNKMHQQFQSDPENIAVRIGPHLKKCHFEVQEDVARQFSEYKDFIYREESKGEEKVKIDLSEIVKKQLMDSGVNGENINIITECTFDNNEKYLSFRRDKPEKVEAMVAYIGFDK